MAGDATHQRGAVIQSRLVTACTTAIPDANSGRSTSAARSKPPMPAKLVKNFLAVFPLARRIRGTALVPGLNWLRNQFAR
jgi:hypothetical protein